VTVERGKKKRAKKRVKFKRASAPAASKRDRPERPWPGSAGFATKPEPKILAGGAEISLVNARAITEGIRIAEGRNNASRIGARPSPEL